MTELELLRSENERMRAALAEFASRENWNNRNVNGKHSVYPICEWVGSDYPWEMARDAVIKQGPATQPSEPEDCYQCPECGAQPLNLMDLLDQAQTQQRRLVAAANRLIGWCLSVSSDNSAVWLDGLADRMNELEAAAGGTDRCEWNGERMEVVAND